MAKKQFRCCIYANDYEQTLAFYRDGLGFEIADSWDRGPDDKGTLFSVASGFSEIMKRPAVIESQFDWGSEQPRGFMVVIEVENVEALYNQLLDRNLSVVEGLKDQEWGHRTFRLHDPNGLELYFYCEI